MFDFQSAAIIERYNESRAAARHKEPGHVPVMDSVILERTAIQTRMKLLVKGDEVLLEYSERAL